MLTQNSVNGESTPKTIQSLLSEGQHKFNGLLKNKYNEAINNLETIERLKMKIQKIQEAATLENIDKLNIIELEKEYDNFKQEFDAFANQNTATDDIKKSFKTIKTEIIEWRTSLTDKIGADLNEIWDANNGKFKQDTRWWFSFWSSKPTQSELEQQKNTLIGQYTVANSFGSDAINSIDVLCNTIEANIAEVEALFFKLKGLHEDSLRKKQEEKKRKQEEETQKQEKESELANINKQQGYEKMQTNSRKSYIGSIDTQELGKIAEWLRTEQGATYITEEDIVEQCREFGVDDFDGFKIAFSRELELEKMQEFLKNEQNASLEKEECAKLFQRYGVKTFEEFREKLNQGAEEIAETIGGERANEIRDKLHNEARNISDYVDCMNDLANNQGKPLIKKVDINLLQARADSLKKKLEEKNIFIQFLMLFGYDPDGLVTAYHIAKDRLKEAKWDERNNLLNNSGNNFINNNPEYSKMYSGNKNVVNNNNIALFGQQSIQQSNTGLGY